MFVLQRSCKPCKRILSFKQNQTVIIEHTHTHTHIYTHIYIYMYIYMWRRSHVFAKIFVVIHWTYLMVTHVSDRIYRWKWKTGFCFLLFFNAFFVCLRVIFFGTIKHNCAQEPQLLCATRILNVSREPQLLYATRILNVSRQPQLLYATRILNVSREPQLLYATRILNVSREPQLLYATRVLNVRKSRKSCTLLTLWMWAESRNSCTLLTLWMWAESRKSCALLVFCISPSSSRQSANSPVSLRQCACLILMGRQYVTYVA